MLGHPHRPDRYRPRRREAVPLTNPKPSLFTQPSPIQSRKQEPASLTTPTELQTQSTALRQPLMVTEHPSCCRACGVSPCHPHFLFCGKVSPLFSKYQGFSLTRATLFSAASDLHVLVCHIPRNNENSRQGRQVSIQLQLQHLCHLRRLMLKGRPPQTPCCFCNTLVT